MARENADRTAVTAANTRSFNEDPPQRRKSIISGSAARIAKLRSSVFFKDVSSWANYRLRYARPTKEMLGINSSDAASIEQVPSPIRPSEPRDVNSITPHSER